MMNKIVCPFCGAEEYEERRTEYLYSYKGEYLLVPNTPVQVCTQCGMVFYEANVLKEIERRFFAIQENKEKPDKYVQVPSTTFV